MRRQNDLFRRLARAPFGKLLESAVRDPALLVWLDAPANRKGHPNENLARELLELFSLGIGHYSEDDVKETARALTGWTVVDGEAREAPSRHDDEPKTILGKTGNWRASDVVRIVARPHRRRPIGWPGGSASCSWGRGWTSRRSSRWPMVCGRNQLDVGWAVATVLRSRAFFAASNLGTRVQSPIEFIVGAVRAWNCSTRPRARWSWPTGRPGWVKTSSIPPNVGGWPGGRSWLSARLLIGRANFATALVEGRRRRTRRAVRPDRAGRPISAGGDRYETISFCAELLLGIRTRWATGSTSPSRRTRPGTRNRAARP